MSRELAQERRRLADQAVDECGRLWFYGRSDRVAGLPMSIVHKFNIYYRAGYEGERRKEKQSNEEKAA